MVGELSFKDVRRTCELSVVGCETTEGLPPLEGILGQGRAVKSLEFGIGIAERGFNIYVAGMPGTGRTTAVRSFLEEAAKSRPVPSDWCYVNNFKEPYEPRALRLPPGRARGFQRDMDAFVEEARRAIPKAFESDDYATRRESIAKRFEKERQELFAALNEKASRAGFLLRTTPIGLVIIPVVGGKPISEEELLALTPELRERIQARRDELEGELYTVMRQLRESERGLNEELQKLNREVALYAIGHLVNEMTAKYKELPEVVSHVENVRNDMVENLGQFRPEAQTQLTAQFPWLRELPFRKYKVNVLVDNSSLKGAPVVAEQNPTYNRLFGRIEKEAQLGALTTDFTMIRGGSLHEANGGYLVLPVEELLTNPFAWDGLKRALKSREIAIEEPGERLGFITAKSLVPQPVPLDVKVVLIGSPLAYSLLYMYDMDFRELFKVKAEFDTQMERNEENIRKYAAFVCGLCRKENLKHLDASAVAKLVEYSSRLAEDQGKLSTRFAEVADVVREASYYATQEGAGYITASHVQRAVEERFYRSGLIQERIKEL
ncbi:MAG: ATP-binding protein, partial [Candidatus Bathyarchaeia archaeon]